MNKIVLGKQSLAGWALEADASNRRKEVSVQIPRVPPDPALPIVGFERNEPFRRLLGDLGHDLQIRRLDPGVVYHSKGRELVRPASVEGWIETGREWFSGAGFREFCEIVWNLSVAAWNFVDHFGVEPVVRPPGFPYLRPSAWQGLGRNKLLFIKASDYLKSCDVEPRTEFLHFVDSHIRFAYGRGIDQVSVAWAALALNAPSVSYHAPRANVPPHRSAHTPESAGSVNAWRIGFQAGSLLRPQTVHQVFFENPVEGLMSPTAVLTLGKTPRGFLYVRSQGVGFEGLQRSLTRDLGEGWGELDPEDRTPLPGLVWTVNGQTFRTEIEAEWPWLGPARAYLEARRPLL